MTSTLPGEQVEPAFQPKRLCNWEVPQTFAPSLKKTVGHSPFSTMKPKRSTTSFIVGDNGHLLPSVPKVKNAFQPVDTYYALPRWPTPNASYQHAPRSTMGYNGRQTNYLPINTVYASKA